MWYESTSRMLAQDEGFSHFDGGHRETFAAALILLCLDEDPLFRGALAARVKQLARLPEHLVLDGWGREEGLDVPDRPARRSDLWLRFDESIVLVEIKTHSGWDARSVVAQLKDQAAAGLVGARVSEAILLAPGYLLRHLGAAPFPCLSWHDFLAFVDALQSAHRITQLALDHWRRTVERDFGLSGPASEFRLDAVASQTACLVAFLRAAFSRRGGEAQTNTVWFSSPDGQPRRRRQWAWIGIAVPGRIGSKRLYFGIYTYTAAPVGQSTGTFLEAYPLGEEDTPMVSIPFSPKDLTAGPLHEVLEAFDAELKMHFP